MELINKKVLDKVKNSIFEFSEKIKEDDNDLTNKLISNWDTIERLFFNFDNNYSWPMSKSHFSYNFGFKKTNVNSIIRRLTIEGVLLKGIDYTIDGNGNMATTHVHESGAKKILEKRNSIEGSKYLFLKYGIKRNIPLCFSYINIIYYTTRGIDNPEKEYSTINNYRIDLYLQKNKLAIECDEHDHENESTKKRSNRQQSIENQLGCKFLRFNPYPQGKDFDIGLVIKVVLHHLFNKLIDRKDPIDFYYEMRPIRKKRNLIEVDLADF
jgi:hypothetical protein